VPDASAARTLPWPRLLRRLADAGLLASSDASDDASSDAPDDEAPGARAASCDGAPLVLGHLTDDSRAVRPGSAFVAVRGTEADGHAYLADALARGAAAVVCEALPDDLADAYPGAAVARVTDGRAALAEAAAAFYGDPARTMEMVGVTGTNGKTTTAWLVHHLLHGLGATTGLLGTIETRIGAERVAAVSSLTTPGPLALHRALRAMADAGCTACAMEVSSHALDQQRVRAVPYDVALFTNLTTDHLDYHGTLANYRAAKKKLFDGLGPDATALYNADDPSGAQMVADTAAEAVGFGTRPGADLPFDVLTSRLDGLRLLLDGHPRTFRLVGRFNAYNLAAAYGVGRALGYDGARVADVLAEAPPVPGRFEQIRFASGTTVIVDYAHTPDALAHVLATCRAMKPDAAALWCVFGCGGDRDRSKRRTMGSLAEQHADRVVVTSDNPRSEEPEAIMNDVRRGMSHPADAAWIVDREAAIRHAATTCAPGDVVVIAGKGHETVQIVGDDRRPFDDREVARRWFGPRLGKDE
jgi:UDP-N-acetylmuramoyl-L-alanyl-D-glutamate--2,6-diaminopimelate ligase